MLPIHDEVLVGPVKGALPLLISVVHLWVHVQHGGEGGGPAQYHKRPQYTDQQRGIIDL